MAVSSIVELLGLIGLGAAVAISVLLAALQLPGTWLIVGAAVIYDWAYDWHCIGPAVLGVLAGLALAAEVVEHLAGALLARRVGGSRRAVWGGLIGGFAGMFVFSLPLPVLGTIAGGIVGCFAGALIGELTVRNDLAHGTRVGVAAALGRIAGMLIKLAVAIVIAGVVVSSILFRSP